MGGKLSTPHKQEQEQVLPFCVPVPLATEGAAAEAAGGGGAAAGEAAGEAVVAADEVTGGGAATGEETAGGAAPIAVPFCCMAIARNIAWVLVAVGLMLKTIPLPQWPFCLQ